MNKIECCEVCRNEELIPVLNLGNHPMCDDLVEVGSDRACKEYPIDILFCTKCNTAHQKYQVPKQELFPSSYHYRSRFTADVLQGMKNLVERCAELNGGVEGKTVIDIGCNDGSLLSFFKESKAKTIGVEPTGAYADAEARDHKVYNDFFTPELASRITDEHGRPDFIVFTNVFAHIEDLNGLLEAVRRLMKPETVVIIENHYLDAVLNRNQFDTFYHEHPRTYSATSFHFIAESLGLQISNLEFPSRYGGNIRVFMKKLNVHGAVADTSIAKVLEDEKKSLAKFEAMNRNVDIWRNNKRQQIDGLVARYGKLKAKAFPGRAAILVKLLGLSESHISFVSEKPGSMKIGHYLPGTRIPIISDDDAFNGEDMDTPLLNLAWHISQEIRTYLASKGYNGEIVDIIGDGDF